MDENQFSELLRYSDELSILVVNYKGKLQKLTCPFSVLVLHDIGSLQKGEIKEVEAVKITIRIITVYIIDQKAYYYFHFEIVERKK